MKKLLADIGINTWMELIVNSGRRKFAFNLIWVKIIDIVNNTDFAGRLMQDEIGTTKARANDYSATPRQLITTLKKLYIKSSDSIIDLGSGKGLAMYYMSAFPFKKIGGIELSKKLTLIAKKNLKKISKKNIEKFEILNEDAGNSDCYDRYNFFYIYNSFPKKVLNEVMEKITQSLVQNPRKVIILYLYPEFPREIVKKGNFILLEKGKSREIRNGMHIYVNREFSNSKIWKQSKNCMK